jgi:hypothetical protein
MSRTIKRNPYWKTLRHYKHGSVPSKKRYNRNKVKQKDRQVINKQNK